MPDRRISVSEPAALAAEKTQTIHRKGPERATAARFLPLDQRRGMYKAFHEYGAASSRSRLAAGFLACSCRTYCAPGAMREIGRRRQLELSRRVA